MKKMTCFVMALAMVLCLAQCKKEQPVTPESEGVRITLDVNSGSNSSSKAEVTPPSVTFKSGDQILVAYAGKYVGHLDHNGSNFSGIISATGDNTQPLYFYYLGNKIDVNTLDAGTTTTCTVNISDQTGYPTLPVISFSASNENFHGEGAYSASLHNKASLMKFNVTTPSDAAICITGMNNMVTVKFNDRSDNDGFSYGMDGEGVIMMNAVTSENTETWAVVLPQAVVGEGVASTEYDGYTYIGTRPAIAGGIAANQYLDAGINMAVDFNQYLTPLTFEAKTAGATVTFSNSTSLTINLQYKVNNDEWTTVNSSTTITLANVGDKVSFRGDNDRLATSMSVYCYFSNTGQCYIYGNLMSLLYSNSNTYSTATELNGTYTFYHLFENASNLYSHAYKTLELPATTLTDHCYDGMFYYCSNLTTAPELPATTLGQYCYKFMFEGCSNLTTVPERLPATTLQSGCYYGMFKECSSLTTAPELPAPTLVYQCYIYMFYRCRQLSSITCLATNPSNASGTSNPYTYNWVSDVRTGSSCTFRRRSTNWATNSADGIYYGWTKIDI